MYPDLAGKMTDSGKLGIESSLEHSAANLDKLTLEEKLKMNQLNRTYKKKFGFPFVICARLNKKDAIMDGLNSRLNKSTTTVLWHIKNQAFLREQFMQNSHNRYVYYEDNELENW